MRVLYLNNSGYGHVLPSLSVVAELVRRGHEVTYVTGEGLADKVSSTGAKVVVYDTRLPGIDLSRYVTADDTAALTGIHLTESEEILATVAAEYPDLPDLIVYDLSVYHAGRILAEKWGVPAAQGLTVFAGNKHFSLLDDMVEKTGEADPRHPDLVSFFARMTRLLAEHGQGHRSLHEFIGRTEDLNLAYFPRSFQFEGGTFDERFVFVGPGLEHDPAAGSWSPPGDGKRLLFISLGTSVNRREGFLRVCVDAFRDRPWHVVMTVDEGVDRDEPGPLPDNVEVHGWLAHLDVLAHADVFLSSAGMGSLMGALYSEVPVVVVPGSPEGWVNARRIAELGLGKVIHEDTPTPERLYAAVAEVAADQLTRARVRRMRADITTAGGGRLGADELEAFVDKWH
ncbi:MAG: glycosyl transferase [Actinomycetota bacterium]|nr:glycosyl transferase [Actinomycetota bacterium]